MDNAEVNALMRELDLAISAVTATEGELAACDSSYYWNSVYAKTYEPRRRLDLAMKNIREALEKK
jgi:hypothetical protein